jgi:hypothetical protein
VTEVDPSPPPEGLLLGAKEAVIRNMHAVLDRQLGAFEQIGPICSEQLIQPMNDLPNGRGPIVVGLRFSG